MIGINFTTTLLKLPSRGWKVELDQRARRVRVAMLREFRSKVSHWNTKPKWNHSIVRSPDRISIEVTTSDPRYLWSDEGTIPHPITGGVRSKSPLFSGGTSAQYSGFLKIVGGGGRGQRQWITYVREVSHPGITARNYTDEVFSVIAPMWEAEVDKYLIEFMKGL